jgi:DDE superfamily endonuclease
MDETGSSIGTIQGGHIVIDTTMQSKRELEIGRQEWVTCIECVCMDGSPLSPMIIFKGAKPLDKWIPGSTEGATEASWKASDNGWTSNDLAIQWLREIFEPQTRIKANGGRRLIICDGHGSHISAKFVAHCMHYKIEVVLLPPHSSHLLQPLDVAVFGPLKTQLCNEQRRYVRAGVARLQKWEWADCYLKARQKAITDHNIKSGWRASGCHPIFPSKVLDKLPSPPSSESDSSVSNNVNVADISLTTYTITCDTATPIRQSIAAKINHLAVANTLNTPARRLIPQITLEYEIALVTNKILKLELKETRDVLAARKERQKGKNMIVKGQHHITTKPILKKLKHAEAETQKRGRSKKKDNKKKELLDVIEVLLDDDENDEEEIEQA